MNTDSKSLFGIKINITLTADFPETPHTRKPTANNVVNSILLINNMFIRFNFSNSKKIKIVSLLFIQIFMNLLTINTVIVYL